jgi:D-alanyl-lipoteichoic acid acyltransferase DltB (MBOAT superfamily)
VNVPSYAFLAFVAIVAVLINVSNQSSWRRAVLLIANLAFVSTFTHDPVQLAPFGALLAFGYAAMKLLESYKRRTLFIALLLGLVLAFCSLKRYTFVPHELFIPFAYMTVGMSYVFFRVVHLVVDAYQDALPGRLGIVAYVNYTLNFTSLVSGPIQLYQEYHRTESERPLPLNADSLADALDRIITGFFKVSIISPLLLSVHEWSVAAFNTDAVLGQRAGHMALAVAVFPVYLYFNFSGYTDFVIGAARLLRLQLPENFKKPFIAEGFIDFWTRWHITLANWVKTYIYSPLLIALMRRFPSPRVEPLLGVFVYFVSFFFVGVWHGQTSMFVFLGVLLGLGVSANKLYQIVMIWRLGRSRYRALCLGLVYSALSRGLTFAYFAFASIWFWSTWAQLHQFAMLLGPAGIIITMVALVGSATVLSSILKAVDGGLPQAAWLGATLSSRYSRTAWLTALVVVTISVTVVLNAPAPRIVYKGF